MVTKKDRDAAWDRAAKIRQKNPEAWRRDELGNPMRYASYGTEGEFGWEIDQSQSEGRRRNRSRPEPARAQYAGQPSEVG